MQVQTVEGQFEKAFQCSTMSCIQIKEKEWVAKNTLLMPKKLPESPNQRELV